MTLSQYSMSSYEERKLILNERNAPQVDFALLEIKQAASLVEGVVHHLDKLKGDEAEQVKATKVQLHAVAETLNSIDGDAAARITKLLEKSKQISGTEGRAGIVNARGFEAAAKNLNEQMVNAYQVVVAKAKSDMQGINTSVLPGSDEDEPKRFATLANVHLEQAQEMLGKINKAQGQTATVGG